MWKWMNKPDGQKKYFVTNFIVLPISKVVIATAGFCQKDEFLLSRIQICTRMGTYAAEFVCISLIRGFTKHVDYCTVFREVQDANCFHGSGLEAQEDEPGGQMETKRSQLDHTQDKQEYACSPVREHFKACLDFMWHTISGFKSQKHGLLQMFCRLQLELKKIILASKDPFHLHCQIHSYSVKSLHASQRLSS